LGKITLVGQAPSRETDGLGAFRGRCGRRLADLAGLTLDGLHEAADAVNLLGRWPGRAGRGDAFPMAEARAAAAAMSLEGRAILVGRAVACAFGLRGLEPLRWVRSGALEVAMVPHPSGLNAWWNSPENRSAAAAFLRGALAPGPRPGLPRRRPAS
jgi:hypothetical protein